MVESFHAERRNIGYLLGENEPRPIIVPPYQRGYSWTKDEVATFWKDLNVFHKGKTSKLSRYFLGPIVVLPGKEEITLLDGQQRLVTATILLSVIRDALRILGQHGSDRARDIQTGYVWKDEDKKKYSLQVGELDAEYFERTIQRDPPEQVKPAIKSHRNIKFAREILTSHVKDITQGKNAEQTIKLLREIKDTLVTQMTLVQIEVDTEEDAFRIFETLNDRGLRLSATDLLLNYLMRKAINEGERKSVRKNWNDMLENMGNRDLSQFLRHYWLSKYGDVKSQGLFKEIKEVLEDPKKGIFSSIGFAEGLALECEQYTAILEGGESIPHNSRSDVLAIINHLETKSALPLLLSGLVCLESKEFEQLTNAVLHLTVRSVVFAGFDSTKIETGFYKAAREIRSLREQNKKSYDCWQAAKMILADINATNEEIRAAVKSENFVMSAGRAKFVLAGLANKLQSSTKEIKIGDGSLEHVFPENPSTEWKNAADLKDLLWHLGNLTLLGTKLNSEAQNYGYERKCKEFYSKSEIEMTKQLPTKYVKWDRESILSRAVGLTDLIPQIWTGPQKAIVVAAPVKAPAKTK